MGNNKLIFGIFIIFSFVFMNIPVEGKVNAFYFNFKKNNNPKSDDYWINNLGFADEIKFKIITQEEVMLSALRSGAIDIIGQFVDSFLITPDDYNNPDIAIFEGQTNGFSHFTMNTQRFPTSIRAFRQGFSYAFDKVELLQRGYGGNGFPADSSIVSGLGVWSCEYELSNLPCSPTNENYYEKLVNLGNKSLLSVGFFDWDDDGFREYFNEEVIFNGSLIWNGTSVAQGNTVSTENGYLDPRWNGYTFLGEDDVRRTFIEVNELLSGSVLTIEDSGINKLASSFNNNNYWEEVEFFITGSEGSTIIETQVLMSGEAFSTMGIKTIPEFTTFASILSKMGTGDFNGVHFAYHAFDPRFLQLFASHSSNNQGRSRWYNSTFDEYWEVIETGTRFKEVLQAILKAQQILWQEQPITVLKTGKTFSMYRTDKFEGFVLDKGQGVFTDWTLRKVHLKNTIENWQKYSQYPFGGTLAYGLSEPMDSTNSMNSNNAYTMRILDMIEEKLFSRKPEDLTYISILSHNWTIQSQYTDEDLGSCDICIVNGSKLTFYLLDNVTWHDGSKFTASDVKFSFEVLKNITSPVYYHLLQNIPTERITVESDFEIVIYLNSSSYFDLNSLEIPIYQKEYWEDIKNQINHLNSRPIGTGPYEWFYSDSESYILKRNENYYRKPNPELFKIPRTDTETSIITTDFTTTSSSPSLTTTTSLNNGFDFGNLFENLFTIATISAFSFVIGSIIAITIRRYKQ